VEEYKTKQSGNVHVEVVRGGRFSRMGGSVQSIKSRAAFEAFAHYQDLT
jgi:hypothetical protein